MVPTYTPKDLKQCHESRSRTRSYSLRVLAGVVQNVYRDDWLIWRVEKLWPKDYN